MRAAQLSRKEKPRYDCRCRGRGTPRAGVGPVVRFANPLDGRVVVADLVHGPITFENTELDDLIILRSDGNPTYNFCVAVDDWDMRITHVIRGDDHINNTPRQINLLRAMGAEIPVYAHLPMILGPDGTKLSKRHGAVSVLQYRDEGFLPEALLNYLARLGWSHGDREIFTLPEMIELFDIHDVNKSAAALNPDKIAWMNQQYMMRAGGARLAPELTEQLRRLGIEPGTADVAAIADVQRERAKTLREMAEASAFFFREPAEYEPKAAAKHLNAEAVPLLVAAETALAAVTDWRAPALHEVLAALAAGQQVGLGKVAQPIRVALSGSSVSPPIDQTLAILGRHASLARLRRAIAFARGTVCP
jgi:glutamyl-tRNA synthetase